jgi:thioredoxin 1
MSVIHATAESFDVEVLQSKEPVLVDFWADWCGPCRMLGPVVEQVAAEASGFKVVKVNVDQAPQLAIAFGVETIPTLAVFKDGKLARRSVGVIPKEEVLALMK